MYLIALAAKVEEVYNKMLPDTQYQDRRRIALEIFYEKIKSEVLNINIGKLFDPEKKDYNQNKIRINFNEVYPGIFDEYISIFNNEKDCVKYGVAFENTIIYSKLLEIYEILAITYLNKIDENSVNFLKQYISTSSRCDKPVIDKDIELLEFLFMFSIILVHKLSHDYHYSNKKMAEYFDIKLASFNSREIIFLKCIGLTNKTNTYDDEYQNSLSLTEVDSIIYKPGLLIPKSLKMSCLGADYSSNRIEELKAAKIFFLTKKDEIIHNPSHSNFSENDKFILNEISRMIKKRDIDLEKCTDRIQILQEHKALIDNYKQKFDNFLRNLLKRGQICLNDALIINNYRRELVLSYEISIHNGRLTDKENAELLDLNQFIYDRNGYIKENPKSEYIVHQKFDEEYRANFLNDFEWILKKKHALCQEDQSKIDYCEKQIKISIDAIRGSQESSVDRSSSPQSIQIAPQIMVVNMQAGSNQIASASNLSKSGNIKNTRKTPPCMLYASSSSSSSASASTVYPTDEKLSNSKNEKDLSQTVNHSNSPHTYKGCWPVLPNVFSVTARTEQKNETPIYAKSKKTSVASASSATNLTPSGDFHNQNTKRLEKSKLKKRS